MFVYGKDFRANSRPDFADCGGECGELIARPSAGSVARRKDCDECRRRACIFQNDPEVIIAAKASVSEKKLQILRTAKAPPKLDFQMSNELLDPTHADWIRFIISMRIGHEYVA